MSEVSLFCRTPDEHVVVVRNWAGRLAAALPARVGESVTAKWWVEERQADAAGSPGPYVQWIDLKRGERVVGRVRLRWNPASPRTLHVESTSEGVALAETVLSRGLAGIASAFNVLAIVAAIGAFGLWVWFAIADWSRIWARVSTFSGGGPGRASKLEVTWLLMGWALGPLFAGFAVVFVGQFVRALSEGRRKPAPDAIPAARLDAECASIIGAAEASAAADAKVMVDLGQRFPGRAP